ncbi:uncharacterized protein LOC122965249 isoform X3 [Acropora millepora]|uniref:uncharacterized protein LOC122965249 isoform X3 n=1 Tax=Acropora millepora TaxID=45264 RepID=UPI001CF306F3|nr:uncharacterized protein LOC122965249 isoform X3 [Acropora millepora]
MFYANDTPEANAFEMVDQERKAVEREMCDGGRKEFRATLGKMLRSSIDPNVQVQVQANMTNPMARDRSHDTPMPLLVDNKQGSQGVIPVTTTEQGCRFFVHLMAFISLLSFVMSATSIALFVAIMNSDINDSVKASSKPSKSLGDAAAPQKLIDFTSELQELKEKFTKLKEELDSTRQELARLRAGNKYLTEGETRNITAQVTRSSDQENFNLMTNSSEQRLMAVISNVWVQVNQTGRELREETTKLRTAKNSSQEEIQRIKRSLTDLRQEVNSRELGINETIHLKLKHNDALQSLRMLLNSSFQEMKDELGQVWSSLNSSEKDLQAMWISLNTTEQELTLKITNVSRITGPKKALGSNGKGGLRGCKYKVHIGNDTEGSDVVDASLEEPMGSRIIGATCSTNYAQEYNLESNISSTKRRRFICNCRGPSQLFFPVGKEKRECRLHYWLCSMI